MTLYPPALMEAVTGDTAISYDAQTFRNIIAATVPNGKGVFGAGGLQVSQRGAGANMSVDVAQGRCFIPGTSVSNQGTYFCLSDSVVNVPLAAPDTTNPRVDSIIARIHDKQADGGTSYGWTIETVTGTPSASPIAPSMSSIPSYLLLANVYVPANATSILNSGTNAAGGTGSITDTRILAGNGDVPKWDFYGTTSTPQSVGSGTDSIYQAAGTFQLVGVVQGTYRQTINTPGRYAVHFCIRLASTASPCNRAVAINLRDTDGTTLKRSIRNTCYTAASVPVAVAGTMYITQGQQVEAVIYQDSGAAVSVTDPFLEANFTGAWVGP